MNNRIDAIITRDRKMVDEQKDLTLIAIEHAKRIIARMEETGASINLNELPLVIHVDAKQNVSSRVAEIFKNHSSAIHEYLETRTRPYILVKESGIVEGPRYATLLAENSENSEIKSRMDQWVDNWTAKILNSGKSDIERNEYGEPLPEEIEKIRQRVKDTVLPQVIGPSSTNRLPRSGLGMKPKGKRLP